MALLSFAGSPHGGIQKLLPEWQSQPRIRPVGLVKHTIVGSAAGAFAYFRDLTGVEATFILPKTGQIWQLMDTDRTADAQVAGNYWVTAGVAYGYLSIETEDDGDPANDPWTRAQLDSITWLDNKLAGIYGWARQQTTAPAQITVPKGGSGHHSMWGINTATSKPNPWTTANGKTCPAAARITQQKTILLPAYIKGSPPQPGDGTGMTTPADPAVLTALDRIADGVEREFREGFRALDATGNPSPTAENYTIRGINNALDLQAPILDAIVEQQAETNRLLGELVTLLTPAPPPVA